MIKEIAAVLAEREPLYRQGAHHAVSTRMPVEEVVGEILGLWAHAGVSEMTKIY